MMVLAYSQGTAMPTKYVAFWNWSEPKRITRHACRKADFLLLCDVQSGANAERLGCCDRKDYIVGVFILPVTLSFYPGLFRLSHAGHGCARAADPGIYVGGLRLMLAACRPSAIDDCLGARGLVSWPRHCGALPLQRTAE